MILKCQKFLGFHLTNRAKKTVTWSFFPAWDSTCAESEGRVDVCVTQSIAHHLRASEPSGITKSSPEHILACYKVNRKHQKSWTEVPKWRFPKMELPPFIIHL